MLFSSRIPGNILRRRLSKSESLPLQSSLGLLQGVGSEAPPWELTAAQGKRLPCSFSFKISYSNLRLTAMPESNRNWSVIQSSGVFSTVQSLADYERLTFGGWLLADEFLTHFEPNCFLAETSSVVHRLMFENVHPWAGAFRQAGDAVVIGGYAGADPFRVEPELHLLEAQIDCWDEVVDFGSLERAQARALLCAFHHIRFERIHPFKDGNGRVGRLLFAAAARELICDSLSFDWAAERENYFKALKIANQTGDLSALANILLRAYSSTELKKDFISPFRLAPRMFESAASPALAEDLNWSLQPKKIPG
jgi:fido (protein-threonine AMPylation protein)